MGKIKNFFRDYAVCITFKSYANETKKDGACIQFLPSLNFWFKKYDSSYANGFFLGWLMWGFSVDFVRKQYDGEDVILKP